MRRGASVVLRPLYVIQCEAGSILLLHEGTSPLFETPTHEYTSAQFAVQNYAMTWPILTPGWSTDSVSLSLQRTEVVCLVATTMTPEGGSVVDPLCGIFGQPRKLHRL